MPGKVAVLTLAFFSFLFFMGGGVGVSWMRNGKSGRLVDVCNSVFEVLVTLR